MRVVGQTKGLSPSAVHGISLRFPGPGHTLLLQEQAIAAVRETLAAPDAAIVERALWKCTIAYVVYDFIRGQSFQRREGARTIGLGAAFHEGADTECTRARLAAAEHGRRGAGAVARERDAPGRDVAPASSRSSCSQ